MCAMDDTLASDSHNSRKDIKGVVLAYALLENMDTRSTSTSDRIIMATS